MIPAINYWAVIAATLSTMVVGAVWYSKGVMGTRWMKLTGVQPEGKPAIAIVVPLLVTLLVSFITSWALAWVVGMITIPGHSAPELDNAEIVATFVAPIDRFAFFGTALVAGIILWAGFTAARFITHDAFEGRPVKLTVLNVVHELVTIVVLSIVIGVWPPALA
ncbi:MULTISPECIES: DUF1761 domain-containing protein [unclassified Leucobacter]|uniref:DUF1761 domain-containing protein n=1 Tax=unclassified Leucobacter TaxID=2621730 RepID=UPI000621795C|nr:DUF1761 domain-containing protein [Leucobacter sp. Ag1]KKI19020.1 hypothetical protein XM48_10365 [Leucobacter sp. Ag1]